MSGEEDGGRDLARLVVPRCGLLEATGDPFEPYRLVAADGGGVGPGAGDVRALPGGGPGFSAGGFSWRPSRLLARRGRAGPGFGAGGRMRSTRSPGSRRRR